MIEDYTKSHLLCSWIITASAESFPGRWLSFPSWDESLRKEQTIRRWANCPKFDQNILNYVVWYLVPNWNIVCSLLISPGLSPPPSSLLPLRSRLSLLLQQVNSLRQLLVPKDKIQAAYSSLFYSILGNDNDGHVTNMQYNMTFAQLTSCCFDKIRFQTYVTLLV